MEDEVQWRRKEFNNGGGHIWVCNQNEAPYAPAPRWSTEETKIEASHVQRSGAERHKNQATAGAEKGRSGDGACLLPSRLRDLGSQLSTILADFERGGPYNDNPYDNFNVFTCWNSHSLSH